MQINWRKLLQKDLPVFISFVLVATLLWWVRAMNTSRDTFIRVPVTYAGVGGDVQFSTTPVDMLTVQIHDTGRRIRMLKRENPHLELSLANKLKNDTGFAATLETKKLLAVAMKMAKGGNADVIKKLNKIGSQVYSPQMQLLPIVADDLNAAIASAFAAQVQNYEENKGKPRIVTGFLK